MGVVSKRLYRNLEEQSITPNKFYSIVLWKAQKQQNKNLKNGNLVALRRSSASTDIIKTFYGRSLNTSCGGDVSINPKHLSFLIGGTGKITKGNLKQ
ncbi:hypothetical protein [Nostoc sp. MS1]|uniref:hypothetical protein n=1 Tax=Nostoc sp. MS1 TaxID=2764711 RepID=UPI001CC81D8D|nr:hypothetical protein [Nostoc sp. MS1]